MSPNARLRRTHPALATRAVRHGRHAAGAPACHVALVLGAALLATTGAATAQRAEDFIGPTITIVRKSNERIVGDFMDVRKLPKTISIDPLTEAEVRDIQRAAYEFAKAADPQGRVDDSWMRAPEACMQ